MRYRRPVMLLVIVAVFVAACGGSEDTASGGAISTAETDLGTHLVDGAGMTLYASTDDADGVSTCYDACVSTWPPVSGTVTPGAALDAGVFTTAAREDDSTQLVAGTWPLYTFSGDTAPGETNGQGSGDVWFMVAPDGSLIQGDSEPPIEATSEAQVIGNSLGEPVLTDGQGWTLYYFSNDEPGASRCNDPCSATWPPVAGDDQIAASGLDTGLLGPVTRDDGSEQLAYDGRPLYRYVDDVAPGDVNGHGVGDVWFAVAADGSEVALKGVRLGSTDAGEVLVDPEGFTLYTFDNDDEGKSVCNAPCSDTWRPVPADVAIDATSVDPEQFSAIKRDDGREQLALNGRALYRFIDDANPGDAAGQGIGDVWLAVPAGDVEVAEDDG